MGRTWANKEERPKIWARGINNVEGEIVTLSRQIKQPTPPFEFVANGGVEILIQSKLMSIPKMLKK